MKPSFALNLSHDGISLLHRSSAGWFSAGFVPLDDDDFAGAMEHLRQAALGLSARGITSKLVIPDSQILYLLIEAPGPDAARRRNQIAAALEGRTPYAVNDLVFDWSGTGHSVQVAVVARETLIEAENFAEQYNFSPVSFVAIPAPGDFAGEPFFGLTSTAAQHLPEGSRLDRDQDPIRLIQTLQTPKVGAKAADDAPEAVTQAEAEQAQVDAGLAQVAPAAILEAVTEIAPPSQPDTAPAPVADPTAETDIAPEDLAAADGAAADGAATTVDMAAAASAPMIEAEPPQTELGTPSLPAAGDTLADVGAPDVGSDLPDVPEAPIAPPTDPQPDLPQPEVPQPDLPQPDLPQPEVPQPADPQPDAPRPEAPQPHDVETQRNAPQDADAAPQDLPPAAEMPADVPPPLDPQDGIAAELPERGLDAVLADESFAPEAIAALAEALQEDTPTTPAARFVSRRSPMTAAAALPTGAPRLGAATSRDLPPPAPKTKALAAEAARPEAPRPSVLTPGLAVPAATEIDAAEIPPLPKGHGAKPDLAAPQGVRAKFRAAAKTIAPVNTSTVRNVPTAGKPDADTAAEPAAKTVFGGPKALPQRNKPRYFGLMLTAALLLFMGVVALWSSLLGTRSQPEIVAPLTRNEADPVVAQPAPAESAPGALEDAPAPLPAETAIAAADADVAADAAPETVPAPNAATDPEPTPTVAPEAVAPLPEPPAPAIEELPETNLQASVWGAIDPQAQGQHQGDALSLLGASAADPAILPLPGVGLPQTEARSTDPRPATPPEPVPYNQLARIAPDGVLQPTPQGVIAPGGYTLYAGSPPRIPAERPKSVVRAALAAVAPPAATASDTAAQAAAQVTAEPQPYADPALAGFRPAARPASIAPPVAPAAPEPASPAAAPINPAAPADSAPAAQPATETPADDQAALSPAEQARRAALQAISPRPRPAAIQAAAASALAARQAEAAAAAELEQSLASATAQAVTVSRHPIGKPRNFSSAVEAALAVAVASAPAPSVAATPASAPSPKAAPAAQHEEIDEPEPVAPAPKLPTNASVAKQATQANALNLGKMNLIGLYGSSGNRRALVRLANGRFIKVEVGDKLDGGRVTGIGDGQLSYQKNGKNLVLKLLKDG